jgi:hypothetical protein
MDGLIEVQLGYSLLAFDGRILEAFGPDMEPATRLHIRLLARWWIDGSVFSVMTPRNGLAAWPFTPEQRPSVEYLLQALDSARARLAGG